MRVSAMLQANVAAEAPAPTMSTSTGAKLKRLSPRGADVE